MPPTDPPPFSVRDTDRFGGRGVQFRGFEDRGPGTEYGNPDPRGGEPRGPAWPHELTATKGFVFVDGEYLSPPYQLRYADGGLSINGRQITALPAQPYVGRGGGYGPPGGPGGFGPAPPPGFGAGRGGDGWRSLEPRQLLLAEIAQHLAGDSIVMSFADQPLITLNSGGATYDLLKLLVGAGDSAVGANSRSIQETAFLQQLPENFDRAVWNRWYSAYTPPDELRKRGQMLIAAYDRTEQDALSSIAAIRRLNAWSYPLSIGLMVVTVLALGHLLGGRPHARESTAGIDESPAMIRTLNWSLAFIALLSIGDLVLTILAGQAGQMREMNPLGSHLIDDTRHLVGYKIGATLPSIGLLWLLRRHKRAQVAAWWLCLILVIVTFRWLTMTSTFVAA